MQTRFGGDQLQNLTLLKISYKLDTSVYPNYIKTWEAQILRRTNFVFVKVKTKGQAQAINKYL